MQKIDVTIRKYATSYTPARNSDCLCGSGDKFKRCCSDCWTLGSRAHQLYSEARSDGDLKLSLKYLRAYIFWYRSCHARHTVPWLKVDPQGAEEILSIDIRALADTCEQLIDVYTQLAMNNQLEDVIRRFEGAIKDERWDQKIIYLYVVAALGIKWNKERAKKIIKERCKVDEITDFNLLATIFDICNSEMTALQALQMVQKLSNLAEREVDKLHYRVACAFHLLMLEDRGSAEKNVREAIDEFRKSTSDRDLSLEERDWLSQALCALAAFSLDSGVLSEAISDTTALLGRDEWTSKGRSDLYRRLADLAKVQRHFGEAAAYFLTSYETGGSEVDLVFSAECRLLEGKFDLAEGELRRVDYGKLDEAGKFDYALIFPGFALRSGSRGDLIKAKDYLLSTDFREPYFRQQQLSILRLVERAIIDADDCESSSQSGGFRNFLQLLSRYIELKPNFMGLGFNFNSVLSDVATRGSKIHKSVDDGVGS